MMDSIGHFSPLVWTKTTDSFHQIVRQTLGHIPHIYYLESREMGGIVGEEGEERNATYHFSSVIFNHIFSFFSVRVDYAGASRNLHINQNNY